MMRSFRDIITQSSRPESLQEYAKPHDPLIFWIISDHFENLFISQQCGCDDNC